MCAVKANSLQLGVGIIQEELPFPSGIFSCRKPSLAAFWVYRLPETWLPRGSCPFSGFRVMSLLLKVGMALSLPLEGGFWCLVGCSITQMSPWSPPFACGGATWHPWQELLIPMRGTGVPCRNERTADSPLRAQKSFRPRANSMGGGAVSFVVMRIWGGLNVLFLGTPGLFWPHP